MILKGAEIKAKNISTVLAIFFFLICAGLTQAQSRQIRFEKTNWAQVLVKAKKEKKMIFLDCYTSWCGPCKRMEKKVFTNDTAAAFYNSNFICVKMDMEKDEGFEIAKKYNIRNYPSLLYLNSAGDLIHITCGSVPAKRFIKNGTDALDPQKQLQGFASRYNSDMTNSKIAFHYFELLESACMLDDSIIKKYFSVQNDSSWTSQYNWKIIHQYADYSSKPFKYLETNKTVFSKLYGSDSVETKINQVYRDALQLARLKRNEIESKKLKSDLRKLKTKNAENIIKHDEQQFLKLPNADMKNALEITDSVIGPVNVSKGFGEVMDYQYPCKGTFFKEDNSAWFKLNIDHDTMLTFDIVPIDSLDDYDFAVFKCEEQPSVKDVKSNKKGTKSDKVKLKFTRACYSYCTSKSGVTGLSLYTDKTNIGIGDGPAYVSGIPVKAGETYYLLVDCLNGSISHNKNQVPLGFTIYFYNYWYKRRPIILNNVFFENNKSVLPSEAFSELDKLVMRLKKSKIKIEIIGHADGSGDEKQNQELSEARAKAVVDYLTSKNINSDRLFFKGLGSTKPIASNTTEDGRQKNRRVEFVIVMN